MSNVWKMIQEKKGNCKPCAKKALAYFGSQSKISRFQTSFINPTVPNYVGFSNRAQRFTGSNYLDVDSPFKIFCPCLCPWQNQMGNSNFPWNELTKT